MASGPTVIAHRVRDAVQRRGVGGAAHAAANIARRHVYVEARHLWLTMPLDAERPHVPLADGLTLRRGADQVDLALTAEIGPSGSSAHRRYLDEGGTPWMICD